VQALIEIVNERLVGPQRGAQVLAGDELAMPFQQQPEHLRWLLADRDADAVATQLARQDVEREHAESNGRGRRARLCGHCRAQEARPLTMIRRLRPSSMRPRSPRRVLSASSFRNIALP